MEVIEKQRNAAFEAGEVGGEGFQDDLGQDRRCAGQLRHRALTHGVVDRLEGANEIAQETRGVIVVHIQRQPGTADAVVLEFTEPSRQQGGFAVSGRGNDAGRRDLAVDQRKRRLQARPVQWLQRANPGNSLASTSTVGVFEPITRL